jgi:1,4-dihydroxy-6-naphthoate synthase
VLSGRATCLLPRSTSGLDRRRVALRVSPMFPVRLAFSPDSDDLFMFWPLLHGKLDTGDLTFTYERADTEALNDRAARGDVDVIAVSIARYASLSDDYLLLPHGASVGRGYGPVVVAREAMSLGALEGKRIGVPGLHTTAHLTLRLLLPRFDASVIPITPYARVFEALRQGAVDAALIIHEGRLLYEREGFFKVVDLGQAWATLTGGLPLPLGGNVVRRALGHELIVRLSTLCRASIVWALKHREEVITALLGETGGDGGALDRPLLDRYLAMYANEDTRSFAPDARAAVLELFRRGVRAGLLPQGARVEFAP